MKVQNTSASYGLLAGLIVMLLGLLANASCAHYPMPVEDEPYGGFRDLRAKALAAVKITTECGSGTGVLIDPIHVLTAHHVINCADWPKTKFAAKVNVQTEDGAKYAMTYSALDGAQDVARLTLSMPVSQPGVFPVRIARVKLGDTVCMATAVPERLVKCAKVALLRDPKKTRDIGIEYDNIWFGNSGSGVYSSDGALVGVASALLFCNPGDKFMWEMFGEKPDHVCGGFATSIPEAMR